MAPRLLLAAALAAGVAAQTGAPYTDSKSGITFAGYQDPKTGAQVGLALPKTYTGDFIGQLVAPVTKAGWVGLSLGPGMTNNLLVVAWPNEQSVVSSFRLATGYVAPDVYPGANFTQQPISAGTFVNSTHYSYTYLCSGCLAVQPGYNSPDVTGGGIGYAVSQTAQTDPSSASGALTFHAAGYGVFGLQYADAQSSQFSTWAGLAGGTGTGGGNSTNPVDGPPSNCTITLATTTTTTSTTTTTTTTTSTRSACRRARQN